MRKKVWFSVIIPVYNEEKNLRPLYKSFSEVLSKLGKSYELIFIDDGSNDSSLEVLKKIRTQDKKVKIFSFWKNFGKSAALAVGFKKASGELVFTMDADLQDRPDQMPKFLKKLSQGSQGYDLVCGWRYFRKDRLLKKFSSLVFNRVTSWLTKIHLHDMNCGFKVFKKEVVKSLKIYGELHRFIPVLAHRWGFKLAEVKIRHSPRKHGVSKFGISRYFSGFFDLLTVMFLTRYISKPLHIFGFLGLISFLLGGGIIGFLAIRKYFFGVLIGPGRPLLQMAVFLMLFGVQFFIFGLLAEIVINKEPQDFESLIKEKLG